ncbi:MAG: hypothetical protein H8D78_03410 [Chloroflexi bacterium]|nr:hypothetical protein [Chloroflexota bacterium]
MQATAVDRLPALVVHADWGSSPQKRWMARATLREDGRYYAHEPEPVGEPRTLVQRLHTDVGPGGSILLGFDFPIGLPARYAERADIEDFLALLPQLGQDDWSDFYTVAEHSAEISVRRPFYPQRPGNSRQRHLVDGLGRGSINDLRRRCERARCGRRAASPLFWTLGAQQVGKAAISGWREVLGPALRSGVIDVAIWPFSGPLFELFQPGRVVIAETYPAEFYDHLGVIFPRSKAGQKSGKRVQLDRTTNAPTLLAWADVAQVELAPALRDDVGDGFGPSADGEDPFDAMVGLLGMLNVVLKRRSADTPDDDQVHRIEGWILGQAAE